MSGSLGTLALYATPPIQSIRQSWAVRKGVDGVNSFCRWPIITDSRHYAKLAVSASSVANNVERSVAPDLAKITASRI
jgi:hypothetical protein